MYNVMIVDDSIVIQKVLQMKLKELGHTVVATAKSGKEAVDIYDDVMPDFVTMDITMPIMNGIEALKAIKEKHADAKVLMITSHGEESLVMNAIISGAKGYVLKPITTSKLQKAIEKLYAG